jgi:iron complex transport system substrate-binding protein
MSFSRAKSPLRIISLAPDATSILFGIGARKYLAGVSKWCKDVAPVGNLPRVGDCWALDVKAVAKLKPTLLIGSVPFKPVVVAELVKLSANFVALNPRSLADIQANILMLGRITGRISSSRKLAEKMRRHFAGVARQALRIQTRPRVYCEAWPKPRISSPPWVAELAEMAGGIMAVPPGQRVSDDEVAKAMPDVIVLAWTATNDRAKTAAVYANSRWRDVPAIRTRRVVVVRDEWLNTPGPPLMHGARELLRALHPEIAR